MIEISGLMRQDKQPKKINWRKLLRKHNLYFSFQAFQVLEEHVHTNNTRKQKNSILGCMAARASAQKSPKDFAYC
jgi:hypothetical protein